MDVQHVESFATCPQCEARVHDVVPDELIASGPGATGNTDSSLAVVVESPGAKRVTSCPRSTRPSASRDTIHSIPP